MNNLFLYSHSKFFRAIYENYGYSLKGLWVVCGSITERNYRLKKLFIWAYSQASYSTIISLCGLLFWWQVLIRALAIISCSFPLSLFLLSTSHGVHLAYHVHAIPRPLTAPPDPRLHAGGSSEPPERPQPTALFMNDQGAQIIDSHTVIRMIYA